MNQKNLALLILESIILGEGLYIDYQYTDMLNNFIYDNYKKYPELFKKILNINVLDEHLKNPLFRFDTQIITTNTILTLYTNYCSEENYFKLVNEIDKETANKINNLVLLFFEYYIQQLESQTYIETPYIKILQ